MPKTLTSSELDELRELLDAIDYRLVTSNGQTLAEATQGEVLDDKNSFTLDLGKEFSQIRRIKEILGLDIPLREQLAREGKIPPYRDKSVIKAKLAPKSKP
jgi:hypothetical protein